MPWPSLKLNYLKQRYYSCTHGIPCLGNGFHKQNIVMTWKSCAKSRRAQALLKELADLSADASQAGAGLWSGLLRYLPGSYWINNCSSIVYSHALLSVDFQCKAFPEVSIPSMQHFRTVNSLYLLLLDISCFVMFIFQPP